MVKVSYGIILFLLAGSIWSCTSVAVDGLDPKGQMKMLAEEISTMTHNRSCKQLSECRTVALGARACGGPKRYVVYSVNNVNETDLLVKASSYNSYDQQLNGDSNTVGTCDVLMPPKLGCQKNLCVQFAAKPGSPKPQ
jgi:hypothetical protein